MASASEPPGAPVNEAAPFLLQESPEYHAGAYQVMPPLQRHLHIAPRLAQLVLERHQPVVTPHDITGSQNNSDRKS